MDNKEEIYNEIISNGDVQHLLALSNDEKQDFIMKLMYGPLSSMQLDEMNHVQRTLYLAMRLEDTCQADALPSLSEEEEIFLALPEMELALEELGAMKTAELLKEFISLVPAGIVPEWNWFFANERKSIIGRLDSEISSYPDGLMSGLYVAYISKPEIAEEILKGLKNGV